MRGRTRLALDYGDHREQREIGGRPDDLAAALWPFGLSDDVRGVTIDADSLETVILALVDGGWIRRRRGEVRPRTLLRNVALGRAMAAGNTQNGGSPMSPSRTLTVARRVVRQLIGDPHACWRSRSSRRW